MKFYYLIFIPLGYFGKNWEKIHKTFPKSSQKYRSFS